MHHRPYARLLIPMLALCGCEDDPKPEVDFGVQVEPCDVVFTEIQALPLSETAKNQYVELYNPNNAPADLSQCFFAIRYGDVDPALLDAGVPDPEDLEAVVDAGPCDYLDYEEPASAEATDAEASPIERPYCGSTVFMGEKAVIPPKSTFTMGPRAAQNVDYQWPMIDLPSAPDKPVTLSITCRGKTVAELRYGTSDGSGLGQPIAGVSFQKDPGQNCSDDVSSWCVTPLDESEADAGVTTKAASQTPGVLEGRATKGKPNRECSPKPSACQLSACGVFFSEVLASPMSGSALDQFIELYNPGTADVDLQGCALDLQIEGETEATAILSGSASNNGALIVPASGRITLGPSIAHKVQGHFDGFDLPQTSPGGAVTLRLYNPDSNQEIDSFTYLSPRADERGAPTRGYAFELCPDRDATCSGNDELKNWSLAQSSDDRDKSSRALPNLNCNVPLCIDSDGNERLSQKPEPGDLVITELFLRPAAATADEQQDVTKARSKDGEEQEGDEPELDADVDEPETDAGTSKDDPRLTGPNERQLFDGQWFEIYNVTDHPIDLNGLGLYRNKNLETPSFVFGRNDLSCVTIPAHSYRVIAANADAGANGGILVEPGFTYANSFTIATNNGYLGMRWPAVDDEKEILIDEVEWSNTVDNISWQIDPEKIVLPKTAAQSPTGSKASAETSKETADQQQDYAQLNNDFENWCLSVQPQQDLSDPQSKLSYHTAGGPNEKCHVCFCIDEEQQLWKRIASPYTPGELWVNEIYSPKDELDQARAYVELAANREGYLNCGSIMGQAFPWKTCKPLQRAKDNQYYAVIAQPNHERMLCEEDLVPVYEFDNALDLSIYQAIKVEISGQEIDRLELSLTDEIVQSMNALQRDEYQNWCETPSQLSTGEEIASIYESAPVVLGTPAKPNKRCEAFDPPVSPDNCIGTNEQHLEVERLINRPHKGDLQIVEIMPFASASEPKREWIELYAPNDVHIDMNELSIQINVNEKIPIVNNYCVALEKGHYAVIAQSWDRIDEAIRANGMSGQTTVRKTGALWNSALPDTRENAISLYAGDILIDRFEYDATMVKEGISIQRSYNTTTRAYEDRWCLSSKATPAVSATTDHNEQHTLLKENGRCN